MKLLGDVQRQVLAGVEPLGSEDASLGGALGRRAAADVAAPHPVPPFTNSAMDGYAVRAADIRSAPVVLPISGEVAAGHAPPGPLAEMTAMRIMTGAPIPRGADTVVKVEDTETVDGKVRINVAAAAGTAVRPAGGDVAGGTVVVRQGEYLTPARLGLLATVGAARIPVFRRPVVAVLSTGDELRPADTTELAPGTIRDANRYTLIGLCREAGAEPIDQGIVSDDPETLRSVLTSAAERADVIVSSGGVSMGAHDPVKRAYEASGDVEFLQVAMQPGKPFAWGRVGTARFFGLPGNPVSVLVSFEQFVRPLLLKMGGSRLLFRPRVAARLDEGLDTNDEKEVFVRVRVWRAGDEWRAAPSGGQSSNVLSALAAADGLAVSPVGRGRIAAGELVECEMLGWPEALTEEEVLGDG